MIRESWIGEHVELSQVRQCSLAGVSRATVYAHQKPVPIDLEDLMLSALIDEEYTRHPFYGSRRMVVFLVRLGHDIKRRRVQKLMRAMGLVGMAPGPNTSRAHPEHKVYPYLLRGVPVVRPNQVWSTDITYIRLAHGFAYLVAIIDWYSRRVLSWRISNSMDAVFCVDCLEEALRHHGTPEIFNSDQGSQFTSLAFTDVLKRAGVVISMDGRGRAFDNIAAYPASGMSGIIIDLDPTIIQIAYQRLPLIHGVADGLGCHGLTRQGRQLLREPRELIGCEIMKKILFTGGTGYIGSHSTPALPA